MNSKLIIVVTTLILIYVNPLFVVYIYCCKLRMVFSCIISHVYKYVFFPLCLSYPVTRGIEWYCRVHVCVVAGACSWIIIIVTKLVPCTHTSITLNVTPYIHCVRGPLSARVPRR